MSSPAEIPHADEALKTLVARFKADPGSSAFHELASALLARGHASEALRIAEHGLQKVPNQVEGRVERAAALLALGRPRVAYVELRRALAIDPTHRRGMRLLGKAYRDAGAPARAAKLLAKRSMDPDYEELPPPPPIAPKPQKKQPPQPPGETWKKRPAIDDAPTKKATAKGAIPQDLFSDLTADLGLGAAVPETPMRRVEVTQIIRRKGLLRPPRSASELAEIDGPIVDTTQPGHLSELDDAPQEVTAREPAPLFSAASAPSLASFTLDDEPLFQEHLPFAVRPVESTADLEPTLDEDPVDAPTAEIRPAESSSSAGDTLVEHLDEGTEELEDLGPAPVKPLTPPSRAGDTKIRRFVAEKSERTEPETPVHPVVEKKRGAPQQKLEIIDPQPSTARIAMAVGVGIVMFAYFFGLGWFLADDMAPWFTRAAPEAAKGPDATPPDVPEKTARAP